MVNRITCNCDCDAQVTCVLPGCLEWHRDSGMKTNATYLAKMGISNQTVGRKPNLPRRQKKEPVVYDPMPKKGKKANETKTVKIKENNPDPFQNYCTETNAHTKLVCIRKLEKQIRKCVGCGGNLKDTIKVPGMDMVFTSLEPVRAKTLIVSSYMSCTNNFQI